MNRRQRDHRKLTDKEKESKKENRSVPSRFDMDWKKTASQVLGKRFRSSKKAGIYAYFMTIRED